MRTVTIEAGRRVGVTSDLHLGHRNILQYCLRPWLTPDERERVAAGERIKVSDRALAAHDAAIVAACNALLGADDVLVLAGDVAWKRDALDRFRACLAVREVYVAVGNHDDEDDLVAVFGRDRVFERFLLRVGELDAVIDHYPGDSWQASHKATFQLYGHVHGARSRRHLQSGAWLLSEDVGIDTHGMKPWLWREEIVPLFAGRRAAWEAWRARAYPGRETGGMAAENARRHWDEANAAATPRQDPDEAAAAPPPPAPPPNEGGDKP